MNVLGYSKSMLLLEGVSNFYKLKLLFFDALDEWKHSSVFKQQSPIPLKDRFAVKRKIPTLKFQNYDKKFIPIVNNNGRNLHIWFGTNTEDSVSDVDMLPTISGGLLETEYVLKQIHFHWESEHTINGKNFPLEGHFVHFRKDKTFEEAMECDNGLCIVSAMYQISKCENLSLETIIDGVEEVCDEVGTTVKCENEICCKDILPKFTSSFYTYHGSLSDPMHFDHENVIWIVFKEPAFIGRKQLKNLTSIVGENMEPVKTNRRNLQEVNDREIIYCSTYLSAAREFLHKFLDL